MCVGAWEQFVPWPQAVLYLCSQEGPSCWGSSLEPASHLWAAAFAHDLGRRFVAEVWVPFCQRQLGKLCGVVRCASGMWFSFLSVHIQVCCVVGMPVKPGHAPVLSPKAEGLLLSTGFTGAVRKATSKNPCTNSWLLEDWARISAPLILPSELMLLKLLMSC